MHVVIFCQKLMQHVFKQNKQEKKAMRGGSNPIADKMDLMEPLCFKRVRVLCPLTELSSVRKKAIRIENAGGTKAGGSYDGRCAPLNEAESVR